MTSSNPTPEQAVFYWLIPSAIDLPRILAQHPPAFTYKIDYFYYHLHIICDKMDYLDPSDASKWTHLMAKRIQLFNRHYKRYMEYLEERGILEINPSYLKHKYTMGYRIAPDYYDGEPARIYPTDFAITQKVKELKQQQRKAMRKTAKTHEHLTRFFNPGLVIDKEGALREIDRLYPKHQVKYFYKGKLRSTRKARFKARRAVERLACQDFYYHVDENIGRMHTNLTNLKKELRSYITYEGKRLVNLDMGNSQPLLSGMLLNKHFYEPGGLFNIYSIQSLNSLLKPKYQSLDSIIRSIKHIMLYVSPESPAWLEFQRYKKIVQDGHFYEEVSELLFPGEPFDKARMKELVFILFFADNRCGPELSKQGAPFRKAFPTVHKIFSQLKKGNKRILSHILQRTESKLIIETATRRIAAEHPHMLTLTVHDSIATTEEHADYVKGLLEEEIKTLTGLDATVRKEMW